MLPQYRVNHVDRLLSPSLVIFEEIVRDNLKTAIELAGGVDRLRPHVKTHKMAALVKLQESLGLHKHKCATIAEAEMIAQNGGQDVLVSYPLVGPNVARFVALIKAYPSTTFRTTVDHTEAANALDSAAREAGLEKPISVLLDLDVGMGRTGIDPAKADELYALVNSLATLHADGLHCYDGHQRTFDVHQRITEATAGLQSALDLRDRLISRGLAVPLFVLGGTPSFPAHCKSQIPGTECSPGTSTLHDASYATKFPDLPFQPAALLLSRVISAPRPGRITLDLGHKAVAADPVGARLVLPDLPEAQLGGQSEEHLVVDLPEAIAANYPPGTPVWAIPMHVCPTVALHKEVYVVRGGEVVDKWEVSARNRVIGI